MPPLGDVLMDPDDPLWFRQIAELAGDTYYRVELRPTPRLLFVSPTVVDHVGYTAEEWAADPDLPFRLIDPRDAATVAGIIEAEPGHVFRADLRWTHRDGSTVWLEHHGLVREAPDGAVILDGTAYNITKEMALQESLEESEHRFRVLAENASDLVVMTGPDGSIEWASPSVTRLMGWTAAEGKGHLSVEFIHPEDLSAVGAVLEQVMRGEAATIKTRLRLADGVYRWFGASITPVLDEDGGYGGRISSFHDIHDLVMAEQALRATMDAALDPSITLSAVRDADGRVVDLEYVEANAAALAYVSAEREDLVGVRFLDFYPHQRDEPAVAAYFHTIETGEPTVLDDYAFGDGHQHGGHRYDIRAVRVGDGINLTWRDVTDRGAAARALAASEEQYRLLAENSSDVVMRTRDNQVLWVSPSLTRMLGWEPEDWVGHWMSEFGHPDDLPEVVAGRESMVTGESVVMRIRLKDKAGMYHWTEVHGRQYVDADGNADGIQSSLRTIDKEVQVERDLQRRALFDDLTGVYKRDEAIARLGDVVSRRRTHGSENAVLFVDVDAFKDVNDTLGHAAGDAVLETLAVRIRESVRASDTIARMGGDEFLVILDGIHDLDEATRVAEKIRAAAARPIAAGPNSVTVTVSVGVTVAGEAENADQVIARADAAMYKAKDGGRNQVVAV